MKMKANDFKNMPEEEMAMMIQGLLGLGYVGDHPVNGSAPQPDYSSPILKPVVARIYPLFIILYALPAALGIATNVLVMMYISKYKLNRDATQAFLVNLAVCHTVQCTFVLPITLMVMLLQNWIFGQFLCFFLPLLQLCNLAKQDHVRQFVVKRLLPEKNVKKTLSKAPNIQRLITPVVL
ncbi:hypothetical protein quinque_014763 [Culex quinquefasciatus]